MYNVTDLGTLGGKNSQANAINDPGDVAGRADDPQRFHAVRWDRRPTLATIDLHDPNWGLGQNRDTSIALSINNAHGQVVGGTVYRPRFRGHRVDGNRIQTRSVGG